MKALYPVSLQLNGKPVLVVGGGRVASRRVRALLECGARVTVVSPMLSGELAEHARAGRLEWIAREFRPDDLARASIVLSATGHAETVATIDADTAARATGGARSDAGSERPPRVPWRNIAEDAARSDFHVPAVTRRGNVTVAVSTAGARPGASARLRDELERWLDEHGALVDSLLGADREVRGDARQREPIVEAGKVYLVGAGPGDPGLLTLRAAELLARADVVFHDRLVSEAVLARIPARVERVYVGKDRGKQRRDDVPALLAEAARAGRVVVRLKGGDPLIFGRAAEEIRGLDDEGVPWEVIPGVSALTAAPAAAGIPLTARGVSNQIVIRSGHPPAPCGDDAPAGGVTLVYFMPAEHVDGILRELEAEGTPPGTPVAIIQKGTLPAQRVLVGSLAELVGRTQKEGLETPALLVVGDVASLASTGKRLPLAQKATQGRDRS